MVKDKNGIEVLQNKLFTPAGREVAFHKSSVNSVRRSFDTQYFVYHKAVSTHQVFLHETTMVHSMAMCMFCHDIKFTAEFVVVDKFFL